MSDQDDQQKNIKAVIPDADGGRKNSAHVDSITFPRVPEDSSSNDDSEPEEK